MTAIKIGFVPAFDSSKEIVNEDGLDVKGTGVMSFQGVTTQTRTVMETGEIVNIPVFVFGVLSRENSFKNIGINANARTLKVICEAFNLEVLMKESETILSKDANQIKALRNFSKTKTIDVEANLNNLEKFMGKGFTGILERNIGKSGKPYYAIDATTLNSIVDEKGNIYQMIPVDVCDPDAIDIDEEEIKKSEAGF